MSEQDAGTAHGGANQAAATGVTLYRPIVIATLYLLNLVTGITLFIGLILAYVWRNDHDVTDWEETHFTYLIRTFWIGFWIILLAAIAVIGGAIAISAGLPLAENLDTLGSHGDDAPAPLVLAVVFGGIIGGFLMFMWFCVRSILSLANAANQRPMPKPRTWLF